MPILTATAAVTAAVLSTKTIVALSLTVGSAIGAAVYGFLNWMFFSRKSSNRVNSDLKKKIEKRFSDYHQKVTSLKKKHEQADIDIQTELTNIIEQLKSEKDSFGLFLKAVFKTIPDVELAGQLLLKLSEEKSEALTIVLNELQNQIASLASENETLKASKKRLSDGVSSLERNLADVSDTLKALKKTTDDERSSYEKMKSQLDRTHKTIKKFKKIIDEKDKQIAELTRKNTSLTGYVLRLTTEKEHHVEQNAVVPPPSSQMKFF